MTQAAKVCAEKQRLGNAQIAAIQEIMKLHHVELASGGDAGLDLAFRAAQRKWGATRWAYAVHLQAHGC